MSHPTGAIGDAQPPSISRRIPAARGRRWVLRPDATGAEHAQPQRKRTLAERLDYLFRTVHPANRGEYSLQEVADSSSPSGGPTISANYLWLLRKGLRDNPTKKHLEALAAFFGVSPLYFFDDEVAARTDAQLDLLVALRDAGVRNLALRAASLSPETLRAITEMVERARQIERVAETTDEHPRPRRGRQPSPPPAPQEDEEKGPSRTRTPSSDASSAR